MKGDGTTWRRKEGGKVIEEGEEREKTDAKGMGRREEMTSN